MSLLRSILPATLLAIGLGAGSLRAADSFDVDKTHAFASFRIKHLNTGFTYGRFKDVGGAITWDNAKPEAGSVEITIDAGSVDTGVEKRDQHLRTADFFDAKQYPTLGFKSTAIKKVDDENYEVTGNLTIHGVTKPVTVKVVKTGEGKDPFGGYRIGFETVFTVKRSDYSVAGLPGAVGDDVTITLATEGLRK
jgi:polyisoprenoid-binding protein YceI